MDTKDWASRLKTHATFHQVAIQTNKSNPYHSAEQSHQGMSNPTFSNTDAYNPSSCHIVTTTDF